MKQSKAVQVTNHKIRKDQKIVYQLYNTCRDSDIISSYKNNFSCQFDSKRDNGVCTCKNVIKVKQREMRYYSGTPKQIYTCRGSRSFTDIGIGRVKVIQRKKVKKVYLPETDDRGVGSSDLSSINRRNKHLNNNSGLRPKSSKCVGGILEYNRECVVNEKLSPIIQTKLETTSLEWVNTETGTNTVDRRLETIGTQFKYENETEKWPSPNKTKEMVEMRLKVDTKLSDKMIIKKTAEERNRIRMERRVREAEIVYSSDSLVQHVHNLENPSDEKQSRSSLQGPMKNIFEREYRKMFSIKSKDSKPVYERPIPEYKSGSILRRRFEALRKSFTKKDELNQEKKDVLVSKDSVAESIQSNKDASVSSDPSSSRAISFSDTIKHFPVVEQERIKTYNVKCKNEPGSGQWPKTSTDSESQGVKGMFKLWGKKFNFEDDSYKKPATPLPSYDKCEKEETPKVSPAKKEGRKFFFFKKKSKGIKTQESYKSKKDVTAGRYEISGLSLKIESSTRKEETKVPDEHGDITRETWLRKFLSQSIESARSVNIRWNNNLYATSSSTVFKLLDTVYKNTGVVLKSRSETTTATSSIDKSYTKHKVNFVHDIEAWMIPKTIPDRQKRTPFKIKSNKEIKDRNIEVTISDQRWDTDKSEAFAHKIEFVLHSKNAVNSIRTTMSSDYLRIDIPKDFFDTSGSDASKGHNQSSDEEVYKIVEYETNSEIRDKKFSKNLCPINQDLPTNNIKVIVSVQDSKNKESNVIETVIKKPTMHRDVLIQGSNVNISQRCDVIGVGVITQRDLREMQKPKLQMEDDLSDEEEPVIEMNQKKCEFAESYLQDYYRNWTKSGVDLPGVLYSWCVSDTHLRSCSEKSLHSLNNQGDDSKSCSNVFDDCQTSCNNSNCNHGYGEDMVCDSFATKLFRKVISKSNTDKARILPKDSLEVSKKRKIYADVQSRIQWRLAPSKPSSSSISECGDDNRPCKKRVSIDQEGDKKGGKHAIIKSIPSCIIPAPPCQSSCEKKKSPLCNRSIKVPTSSCNMGENSPGARSNLSLGKKKIKDKESDCLKSPRTLPSSCITTPCNQKCPPPPPSPCIPHVGESPPLKPLPGKSPPCKSPQCKSSPCNPSPYHLFPSDSPSRKSPPCDAPLRKLPPRRPPPSLESSSRKSPVRTTPPMCTLPPSTAPPCKSSTFRSPQCMSTPVESLLLETQQKTSPSDKRKPYKTLMTVMSPMTPQACRSPRGTSAPRASHPSVHMLSNAKKYQQCAPSPPAKKSSGCLCTPAPPCAVPKPPCDPSSPRLCKKARPDCQLFSPPCLIQCLKKTDNDELWDEIEETYDSSPCSMPPSCLPKPSCDSNLPPLCKKARPDCQLIPPPCLNTPQCSMPPSCLPGPSCDPDLPRHCKKARPDCQPPPCLKCGHSPPCSTPPSCLPEPSCDPDLPQHCKKTRPDCHPPPCLKCGYSPPCSTPPSCLPEPPCDSDLPPFCKVAHPDCHPWPCLKCGYSPPCSTPPSCLPEPPCDSDLPPLCKVAHPDCHPPPCLKCGYSPPCSTPPSCLPEPPCDSDLPPLCKEAYPDCQPPPCLKCGHSPPCSTPPSCLPEPSCDPDLPQHCKKTRPDCHPPPCLKCGYSPPCSTPPSCLPEPPCDSDLPPFCKVAHPDCHPWPCLKCGYSPPCSTPPSCLPEPPCDSDLPPLCKEAYPDCQPPPCLKCGYSPPCSTPPSCLPEPSCDPDLPQHCKKTRPDCHPLPCLKCGYSPPCSTPPSCLPEPPCDSDLPPFCKVAHPDCHPWPCLKCGYSPPCSTPPSCLPEPPCDSDLPPLCKVAHPDCHPPPCLKCGYSPPCSTPPSCLPEPPCDSDLPPLCKEAYPDCQPPPCLKCGYSPPCSTPPSCLPEPPCDSDLPPLCKVAHPDCQPPPCLKCGHSPSCSTPPSCLPEPSCDPDLPRHCKKARPDCHPPPCLKCGHSSPCSTPPSCLPEPPCDSSLPPLCKKARPACQLIPPPCLTPRPCSLDETETEETGDTNNSCSCSFPSLCPPTPPCELNLPPLCKKAHPDCQLIPPPCLNTPPCSTPPSCLPEPSCNPDLPRHCKKARPDCQLIPPPCLTPRPCSLEETETEETGDTNNSCSCSFPSLCPPTPPCELNLPPLCKKAHPDCQLIPPPCLNTPPCSTPPSCLPEPSCNPDLPRHCKKARPDCQLIPPPCLKCGHSFPCSTPPSCLPEPPCDSDLPPLCKKARPDCQLIPPPCLTPRPCCLEETEDTNNSSPCSMPPSCIPEPSCDPNLPPLCKKALPDCLLIPPPCLKHGQSCLKKTSLTLLDGSCKNKNKKPPCKQPPCKRGSDRCFEAHLARSESSHDFVQETCLTQEEKDNYPWPTNQKSNSPSPRRGSLIKLNSNSEKNSSNLSQPDSSSQQKQNKKSTPKKSKMSGLHLVMKPCEKKRYTEAYYSSSEDIKNNDARIKIKLKSPSSSTEEVNIKVRDADGQTLYETRNYCAENKATLNNPMYRDSNYNRPMVFTNVTETQVEKDLVKDKSDSSIPNLIEIQLKLRIAQVNKTTEFNIENDNGTELVKSDNGKKSPEVYVVKNETEAKNSAENSKNDMSIKIVVRNYKQKQQIYGNKHNDDLSKKNSNKCHTVSTCYSDLVGMPDDDQVISIHRATINLSSSTEKTSTENIHCCENCTENDEVMENIPSHSIEQLLTEDENIDEKTMSSLKDSPSEKFADETKPVLPDFNDTDEQDATLLGATSSEYNVDFDLPTPKEEKKALLKKVIQRAHRTQGKDKVAVRQLRNMLKILTDSRDNEHDFKTGSNELAKDVTYTSLKPNYFRDTDSMTNYYQLDSNFSSKHGDLKERASEERSDSDANDITFQGCMCSKVAAKLNDCKMNVSCCCRNKLKKNEETNCDIRNEEDLNLLNYNTEYVNVETQNSKYFASKANSFSVSVHSKQVSAKIIEDVSVERQETNNTVNVQKRSTKVYPMHRSHIKESNMKKNKQNSVLGILDDDRVLVLRDRSRRDVKTVRNKYETHRETTTTIFEADILQSYETKKAVLEIYAEKTKHGEHLVAKLPKFVYDRENEIANNQEQIAANSYKTVCKQNIVMMSLR